MSAETAENNHLELAPTELMSISAETEWSLLAFQETELIQLTVSPPGRNIL